MLKWVAVVLAPHVATAPAGVVPILFLDSFKVHMMDSVASAIEAIGVEVDWITAGCTGLSQPVDVGYNKPFKSRMRNLYTEWLMDQNADMIIRTAMRIDVLLWIVNAMKTISAETVYNLWRKMGYSYFD